jgi:hypothetical protein
MAKESQIKFDLITAFLIAIFMVAFIERILVRFNLAAEEPYCRIQIIVISWCFGLLFGWQPVNKK